MTFQEILSKLESMADPEIVQSKREKFGITAEQSLGIYQKDIKAIAKKIGQNNELALALFESGIYEARLLCRRLFCYQDITEELMEQWVGTFENWEICDTFCMSFFSKTPYAVDKALEWTNREPEFEKRAGFVIMASYGFANKKAGNQVFEQFLSVIERESMDERVYVKKAMNWALRNIGKRNRDLRVSAIASAERILTMSHENSTDKNTAIKNKAARWVAKDALRALNNPNLKLQDYPRATYR